MPLDTKAIRHLYKHGENGYRNGYGPTDTIGHLVIDTVQGLCDEVDRLRAVLDDAYVPKHVRGIHPEHFRSGQWASIREIVVEFPDGVRDNWCVNPDGGWDYEYTNDDERRIADEEPSK